MSPQIGIGRFYAYGRATAQFGKLLAQDYIGLSRYDDFDIQLPILGAITLDDAERVRGYLAMPSATGFFSARLSTACRPS